MSCIIRISNLKHTPLPIKDIGTLAWYDWKWEVEKEGIVIHNGDGETAEGDGHFGSFTFTKHNESHPYRENVPNWTFLYKELKALAEELIHFWSLDVEITELETETEFEYFQA